jgi:hypothetical protein
MKDGLNIHFEMIESANFAKAADCLSYVFHHHEPVTSSLGLNYERYKLMVRRFCRVVGKNGLCFTAIDSEKDIAVGTITNIDQKMDFAREFADDPEDFSDVLEKLYPDMQMTGELVKPYLNEMNFEAGQCLNLFQCGILPEYSGFGVASKLVDLSIEKAIELGYKYALVTCTSDNSKRIFDNRGFEVKNEMVYCDFVLDGEKPFKNIAGKYVLLAKRLR